MTEDPEAGPPAEGRLRQLRAIVRWFVAELAIIVTGILLALAVQAWWEGRGERALEREYLHELLADLRETERVMAAADSVHVPTDRAGALLVQAFFTPERPPRDSVLAWFLRASGYQTPRPVLGTAEALVSTGDLSLLNDRTLRAAVTAYIEESRMLIAEQQFFETLWNRGQEEADRVMDLTETFEILPQARLDSLAREDPLFYLPAGPRRQPFPVDTEALLSNRAAYEGIVKMNVAKKNMATFRAQMREGAQRLRTRVEAALADEARPSPPGGNQIR
ncbi:MAG TPA: hypothetical protein VFR37_15385 [Longimicrobium sp.]|nr:hypothetical protein [Longimicrobium sp.]